MKGLKKLAGETAIYGVPSIVGRFLNWWLVPLYTRQFATEEYGIVSNVYAYVAFFIVLLTYGMETSYFRYAAKGGGKGSVYPTTLMSLFVTSLSFIVVVCAFAGNISSWMGYGNHPEYIVLMGITVALDAFTSIPYARLRLQGRAVRFSIYKFVGIGLVVFLNLFFIYFCPKIAAAGDYSFINFIYREEIGIGYVFISNLIASAVILVLFIPDLIVRSFSFSWEVLLKMLNYSWPLLVVGIAGMVNQNIEKILLPKLLRDTTNPMGDLGVYSANFKLGVLMSLFIQAFRYSFEPFFFSQHRGEESKKMYVDIMKYFVILGLVIFLVVTLYIDIIKVFIGREYHGGLHILPWILMGNFFMGIYYTLSVWYKLTDKTRYGAKFSVIGAFITVGVNVVFIPVLGYMASVVAFCITPILMSAMSYYQGKKHFPISYDIKRLAAYILIAMVLFFAGSSISLPCTILHYAVKSSFLIVFLGVVFFFEAHRSRL